MPAVAARAQNNNSCFTEDSEDSCKENCRKTLFEKAVI